MSIDQGTAKLLEVSRYCGMDAFSVCELQQDDIDPVGIFLQQHNVFVKPEDVRHLAGSVITRALVDSIRLPCGDCLNDGSIKHGVQIHEFVAAVLAEQLRRNRVRDLGEPDV